MTMLQRFILEYPWGYQEVYATSKTAAKTQATSEPLVAIYTGNEWNAALAERTKAIGPDSAGVE